MQFLTCISGDTILVVPCTTRYEDAVENEELSMPPFLARQFDAGANLSCGREGGRNKCSISAGGEGRYSEPVFCIGGSQLPLLWVPADIHPAGRSPLRTHRHFR